MKHLSIFCFTLLSFCLSAQNKDASVIKIYLEDAETRKNIDDAKVTLEGFEIPAITGQYDKKGKYYYFDKIPTGYNTIMAYHKKYNEKGFQNTQGLPKELKLQLHSPYRVKVPGDSINFYKEDDYHICISFNDTILNTFNTCPDFSSKSLCFAKEYITAFHKDLIVKDELSFGPWGLNIIVVEKKNKKKIKRFNDPVIKKLVTDKNILGAYTILMLTKDERKTYFDDNGKAKYIPKYIKYIHCDALNNYYQNTAESVKPSKTSPEKIRNNHYSNIYLDFKEKLKSGLLKNNIYKRNEKEIDGLSNSDQMRINNGELLDNFQNLDTILVSCQKSQAITNMAANSNNLKQYIATSDMLFYNDISTFFYQDVKLHYKITYAISDIIKYKKESSLIELKKTNEEIEIYRIKNNMASPLGTMDIIEYYNSIGIKIYQKIEKNINR
jgi:hypothetical protein